MVKTSQHPAGTGCQAKRKSWNLYVWLIICGLTGEIFCTVRANGKQVEPKHDYSHSEESFLNKNSDEKSHLNDHYRYARAVPPVKTTTDSSLESKSDSQRKLDYVLKIPLSVLRQYELYRVLRWQENEEENYQKPQSVIPMPQFGRSDKKSDNDIEDIDKAFRYFNAEQDNQSDSFAEELFKNDATDTLPLIRNKRSMLLLSSPKSEEATKQKPTQTFVLPYPRPGRSSMYSKVGKAKTEPLILPYDQFESSGDEEDQSKLSIIKRQNNKYILPIPRFGRSTLDSVNTKEKNSEIIENLLSGVKSELLSQNLDKEYLLDKSEDNSFFVIPYPRPGKKSMFKSKNSNQDSKSAEKAFADYVLPYPRPGKKSGRENAMKFPSSKSKGTKNIDYQNLILPYPRPGKSNENVFHFSDADDIFDQSIDVENNMKHKDDEMVSREPSDLLKSLNKKIDRKSTLPYVRLDRNFENIVPYPRPGRAASDMNKATHLLSDVRYIDSNGFVVQLVDTENGPSDALRFKRSASVVPYPRLGRSDSVVPYPRLGRSNAVVPYPRLGRSNSGNINSKIRRSNSVVPYPRLGRSNTVVPYPRIGRSKRSSSVDPYPRLERSDAVVPYPRPGRTVSVVPYPRPGRAEFLVPYPRPGRSDSPVPNTKLTNLFIGKTPLPNNSEKMENWLLPNIRPGRSNVKQEDASSSRGYFASFVRPGSSENEDDFEYTGTDFNLLNGIDAYTRNGRSHNGYVLPHPRVGRSSFKERNEREMMDTDTVIPYPRLGRSEKETIPFKTSSESQNSVHKLNKHMITNVDDSVYILPYPRPG